MTRVVAWFSNGAASAVASRMALAKYGDTPGRVVLACIDTRSEHPDNCGRQLTVKLDGSARRHGRCPR